jgi:hypothetical protein
MISFLALVVAASPPVDTQPLIACDGVRVIEAATIDRPLPFASLRKQEQEMAIVRNGQGQRVQQLVPVTNVKPINGFTRCRFVYSSQIDLACYVGGPLERSQTELISARLAAASESIGQCISNQRLVRSAEEVGSTPVVTYGGGPREPFWQVAMVSVDGNPNLVEAEVLVLGPSHLSAPAPPPRAAPKAKRKRR